MPEKPPLKPAGPEQMPKEDISKMAGIYVNLPNDKLEAGVKNLLAYLKKSPEETQTANFLRGILNLEMYYDLRTIPARYRESKDFASQALQFLSKTVEKNENFAIKITNSDKKEIDFGNLALSYAYLGDLFVDKYFEDGNAKNWQKANELYRKAISLEDNPGLSHELKSILNIRELAINLGNEKIIRCRKTTKREDLRNQAADLFLEYEDKKIKKTHFGYIDITGWLSADKQQKQKYGPTHVAYIPEKINNLIAGLSFDKPLIIKGEKPSISAVHKTQKTLSAFSTLSSKLEESLNLKGSEKEDFRKNFWMDENKFLKFFPMKQEDFIKIRSQWWL